MFTGYGSPETKLTEKDVQAILAESLSRLDLRGKRVLVIIPDATRSFAHDWFFHSLCTELQGKAARVDFLVALGTHRQLSQAELEELVGITAEERITRFMGVGLYNHQWDDEETLSQIGVIDAQEVALLSNGLLALEVPVRVNRRVLDCDAVLVCGPVFPHEAAGFSGGEKYFFPGVGGPDVTNFLHWLGALNTCYRIIGAKDAPTRRLIHRATSFIPTPKIYCCAVTNGHEMAGLYVSDTREAWEAATELSAQMHIRYMDRPFRSVLADMPSMYDDLWTGSKGMYKHEPVVADGGELIIYAPHIKEVSYTHGEIIDRIGYHVRDYFLHQWERFREVPWGVLGHSTYVRGMGTYEQGIEKPRIQVTLATGISRERCLRLNLGYRDPAEIRPQDWQNRESEGMLYVPHAGEVLYRLKGGRDPWDA